MNSKPSTARAPCCSCPPGALSRYLVEGHGAVRKYRSVLIWGRDPQKAAAVARDLSARGWPVSVETDLESAARSADVISCATLAQQPLIKGSWLKATCHLDLVGSFRPNMREADDECLRDAFIAVDTHGALKDSGDLIENPTTPHPHKTVFKSVGVALADLAVAEQLYERNARAA